MKDRELFLTEAQLSALARYELDFRVLLGEEEPDPAAVRVCWDTPCAYSIEDLLCALRQLQEKNPTVREFTDFWFLPIDRAEEAFQLDRARGYLENAEDLREDLRDIRGLPVGSGELFAGIWWDFFMLDSENDDDTRLTEALDLQSRAAQLEQYLAQCDRPITEWTFTLQEKLDFLKQLDEPGWLESASQQELLLCRQYTEELCACDNVQALRIRAYACYGGDQLYPCDWVVSRDCMQRLFALTDDPQYANSLGYIYYYGRCSDGEPNYHEALRWFSISAANGLYEGMYKLGDMYLHGYGCRKSPRTARQLYGMVYRDCVENNLEAEDGNLADAALRMGNVFAQGISEEKNAQSAWYYYLQADYAARLRARKSDFFGNATVVRRVTEALDAIRPELPEDYLCISIDYARPAYFDTLVADGWRARLSLEYDDGKITRVSAQRLPRPGQEQPKPILLTVPRLSWCTCTDTVTLELPEKAEAWLASGCSTARFDECRWNEELCRVEFWNDGSLTGWLRTAYYRLTRPDARQELGEG